jgi:hypothetical protein
VIPASRNGTTALDILTTRDEAESHYRAVRQTNEILSSIHINDLNTDWYAFYESVSRSRDNATGAIQRSNHVVLFPVRGDGIVGEIVWPRSLSEPGWPQVASAPAHDTAGLPSHRVDAHALHERILDGIRAKDTRAIVDAFAPDAWVAVRNYFSEGRCVAGGQGRDVLAAHFDEMFAAVEVIDATVLNRVTGGWYIFAEVSLRLRHSGIVHGRPGAGEDVEVRTAEVFGVDSSGTITGVVGYGTDMTLDSSR